MTDTAPAILLVGLVPLIPLLAAVLCLPFSQRNQRLAAGLVVTGQVMALICASIAAISIASVQDGEGVVRQTLNFSWFEFGSNQLQIGILLDPMNAAMLVMVTLVGLLVSIYSTAYMADDDNSKSFFCYVSFFSFAMLGLLVANSLLLLFICWELVGLASYLLIGFWFQKPAAAAAARKAFIVTRIGDVGLFLGMIWLYQESATLLFYNGEAGVLESGILNQLSTTQGIAGLALSTAIALLIFCGACGKSGQYPLHVWLPDAMEGPTPVSALIHAATMVAAGVFLVARMFPLFAAAAGPDGVSAALTVVTWVGAATALLAALTAVAQTDIKRILAYSTVSQLGFMMLCLGVGGVSAALFHLIAHAFFKALLFLGAGSVIHGCHEDQDIRNMGGLRRLMPVTFATYSIGMMALAGFPLLFSGFWSKEAILHAVHEWPVSQLPFAIALMATFLTAFYMSRQMILVFFGKARGEGAAAAHESARLMTIPLIVLAVGAILPGLIATPAWPWFNAFINGQTVSFNAAKLLSSGTIALMLASVVLVASGVTLAWLLYGRNSDQSADAADPLDRRIGPVFGFLAQGMYFDAFYSATILRGLDAVAALGSWIDRIFFGGMVRLVTALSRLLAASSGFFDTGVLNSGFNAACSALRQSGTDLSDAHRGNLHQYLTTLGAAAALLILILAWL